MRKLLAFLVLMFALSPLAYAAFGGSGFGDGSVSGGGTFTKSGSDIYNANTGNVSIGTTASSAKLTVAGTMNAGQDGTPIFNVTTSSVGIGTSLPLSTFEIMKTGSDKLLNVSLSPTGNGDAFTIDGTGNVGIGTPFPLPGVSALIPKLSYFSSSSSTYSASVNTPASFALLNPNSTTNNTINIAFDSADTNNLITSGPRIAAIFTNHTPAAAGGDLAFNTVNTNTIYETMRMLNNGTGGYVGIGTTVPNGKLVVKGGGTTTAITFNLKDSADAAKFTVLDSGNVGIGSVTPGGKLIVAATTGIGWTVKSGANTACNTTCPATSGCVFGEDTSVVGTIVACTDATADVCLCAGP